MRTASTSLAISDSDTIEVSSTTTTSCGSRLWRLWRKRLRLPGWNPSRRCSVDAGSAVKRVRTVSATGIAAASVRTASSSRAAALAVGAARATRGGRRPAVAGLLVEQGEDAGDRRRLAGARSAGDDCEPAAHGGRCSRPLEIGLWSVEVAVQSTVEQILVDGGGGLAGAVEQVGGDAALQAPVAVEVQQRAVEAQRAVRRVVVAGGDQRAGRQRLDPGVDVRPRECLHVDRLVEVGRGGRPHGGEVDADVGQPRGAHREGDGEEHRPRRRRRPGRRAGWRRGHRRRRARRRG